MYTTSAASLFLTILTAFFNLPALTFRLIPFTSPPMHVHMGAKGCYCTLTSRVRTSSCATFSPRLVTSYFLHQTLKGYARLLVRTEMHNDGDRLPCHIISWHCGAWNAFPVNVKNRFLEFQFNGARACVRARACAAQEIWSLSFSPFDIVYRACSLFPYRCDCSSTKWIKRVDKRLIYRGNSP